MSRQASPLAVGLFVLGAAAVAVLGVILFGGSNLLRNGERYRIHFDESLKGLRVGAPVTFRGVEIGQVRELRAIYDPASGKVEVPVTVELQPGSLSLDGDAADGAGVIPNLVAHGLRARLDLQSIVTGQLLVALDFFNRPGATRTGPWPATRRDPLDHLDLGRPAANRRRCPAQRSRDRPHAAGTDRSPARPPGGDNR